MLKVILLILISFAVLTAISLYIPDPITTAIDNALIDTLSQLWILNFAINISVLFICLQILVNFVIGLLLFEMILWLYESLTK